MADPITEFLKSTFIAMGNAGFDADSFCESKTFEIIKDNCMLVLTNPDQGSEVILKYWEEKGLKKELHDTERVSTSWASYLPMSYVNGQSEGKTYPLLFVMHGHNNPISLVECYGYTNIAAREEVILIIPSNENADNVEALLAYAKEHYPVDWSRVYMVGYSLGGAMTSRHALRWPERFAAVGVGGMLFANGVAGDVQEYEDCNFPGEPFTDEMIAHAKEVKIPVCHCMGENEFHNLLPLYGDPGTTEEENEMVRNSPIDWTGKNKIASVNNWRIVAGCEPVPMEEAVAAAKGSEDTVTRRLGFPFEKTYVVNREERSHLIGDCINSDGENLARFIGIEQLPHFPSQALCDLTWEFISQFARDPETKKLITLRRNEQ